MRPKMAFKKLMGVLSLFLLLLTLIPLASASDDLIVEARWEVDGEQRDGLLTIEEGETADFSTAIVSFSIINSIRVHLLDEDHQRISELELQGNVRQSRGLYIYDGTGSYTATDAGTYYIAVAATNTGGSVDTHELTLLVNEPEPVVPPPNNPPVFDAIRNQRVDENEPLSFFIQARDSDNEQLSFSMDRMDLPESAVLNEAVRVRDGVWRAEFTWTPGEQRRDTMYRVNFNVFDEHGASDSRRVIITVHDIPPQDSDGDGVPDNEDVCPGHNDNDDLDNDGIPDGCDIDIDGDNVPNNEDNCPLDSNPGQEDWNNDGEGDACDEDIQPVNAAPTLQLNPSGDQEVDENTVLTIDVSAQDDGGAEQVTLTAGKCTRFPFISCLELFPLPQWAVFNTDGAGNGDLVLRPTYDTVSHPQQEEMVRLYVKATDAEGLISKRTFWVNVNDVNQAPVLNHIEEKRVQENTPFEIIITGSDPDGDAVSYSEENMPEGANFDRAAGIFSWTPGEHERDTTYLVTFRVSDGRLSDEREVRIVVINNRAPEIDDVEEQIVREGEESNVEIRAIDSEGDVITVQAHIAQEVTDDLGEDNFDLLIMAMVLPLSGSTQIQILCSILQENVTLLLLLQLLMYMETQEKSCFLSLFLTSIKHLFLEI